LHADDADLQALVPLHELMPVHFTPPVACPWAAVAMVPAAKMAVAVAARVFLVMLLSITGIAVPTMTSALPRVKSGLSADP